MLIVLFGIKEIPIEISVLMLDLTFWFFRFDFVRFGLLKVCEFIFLVITNLGFNILFPTHIFNFSSIILNIFLLFFKFPFLPRFNDLLKIRDNFFQFLHCDIIEFYLPPKVHRCRFYQY
jgi:hypothetical protein